MFFNNVNNSGAKGPNGADQVSAQAPGSETSDMFTKLLVAQIRNQDPLAPSDPAQFVNQLSQLSQTEAMQSMSKVSSSQASILQSLQVLALGAQVGSDVMVAAGSVQLDGAKVSGSIELTAASAATDLVLTGADGVKHTIALGSHRSGPLAFTIDPQQLGLAPGRYSMQVSASNGQFPEVEIAGRLEAVRMSAAGGIILKVAGVGEVAPSSVTGFNGKSTAAAATPTYAI
ncbi:flagellar hook capping FlgD N-terminal domain-containing protein [Massilia soli]|uniref:Basal-body rod modification protein FlgD n=1 Tax=Massilia soli TaxID=2792854 RepID=A0ABS7SRR3_9BURK|nr:flagellar hook capping FlgD N-terminal domain-containing protein [Massilia soli]MBZ2208644.1 flagellar basal body rod modification protein [Massilia soli]